MKPKLYITGKFQPDVSVLIVNYNGLQFLDGCLASLKTAFKRYSHEIVLVDNASSDGSQRYLRERTDIKYIESSINLGFTGGNNLAGRHACGKILLLLNNDTRIEKNLDSLIDQAMAEQIGVAGSRLIYGDGRLQFSVGFHHRPLRLVLSWLGLEKIHQLPSIFRRMQTDPFFYAKTHAAVDWVSGACLATRKEIWDSLGGLDEAFFMYCEDVDYCLRVRNAGYKISYDAESLVTHYEGAGRTWIGLAALQRTGRSYAVYLEKHQNIIVSRIASLGLAAVFLMRSAAFAALKINVKSNETDRKKVMSEKYQAYILVAWQFTKHALFGADKKKDGGA